METTITKLRAWPAWKKSKRLSVSALCEDLATGARVDEFCQGLAKYLGPACGIAKETWPLTELRTPNLRAIAATEAASADLIVISVHHAESLPAEVKDWINLWLRQKGDRLMVLLALFDPLYLGTSSSIQTYLQGVAHKGNLEFLAHSAEAPEET